MGPWWSQQTDSWSAVPEPVGMRDELYWGICIGLYCGISGKTNPAHRSSYPGVSLKNKVRQWLQKSQRSAKVPQIYLAWTPYHHRGWWCHSGPGEDTIAVSGNALQETRHKQSQPGPQPGALTHTSPWSARTWGWGIHAFALLQK